MLNTILVDNYPNKEIIIIDDGSTDKSNHIITEWIKTNRSSLVIKYKTRKNKGVCGTLNELIRLSTGKYILPIASDDLLIPDSITNRIEILENNPDKMVLITDSLVIDENDNIIMDSTIVDYNKGDKLSFYSEEGILLSTLTKPQISGPSVLMKSEIFNLIGEYKENLIAEDWYFYQRCAALKLIVFKDIICSKYRVHSNNSSGIRIKRSSKMAWTIVLTYWYNWNFMPSNKYKIVSIKEMLKWFVRYITYKIKK
jgi:glycosyltransferase involved in cell wall biosynthesis